MIIVSPGQHPFHADECGRLLISEALTVAVGGEARRRIFRLGASLGYQGAAFEAVARLQERRARGGQLQVMFPAVEASPGTTGQGPIKWKTSGRALPEVLEVYHKVAVRLSFETSGRQRIRRLLSM